MVLARELAIGTFYLSLARSAGDAESLIVVAKFHPVFDSLPYSPLLILTSTCPRRCHWHTVGAIPIATGEMQRQHTATLVPALGQSWSAGVIPLLTFSQDNERDKNSSYT
jgi:hypothetical protein